VGESGPIRTSVIIVGGGPVGLGLAAALGTAGIPAVLLERRKDSSTIPKGQNLTARTLEHFYFWGCADQLRAARLLPPEFPIGGITAYSSLADKHWYAPPGRETVSDFYFQRPERLPQYLTESVLRDRVAALDAVVGMFGWSAAGVCLGKDGVRVTAVADSGEEREIEAAFVVGCDGGHSLVREQAGIAGNGVDLGQRMVLAVFRSAELNAGLDRFPKRTTYRVLHPDLQGYWQFFGRVDATQTWFFHAPVPADATAATLNAQALVAQAAGFPVACEFEYVGLWTMRTEIADTYQNGRAFIAGDAAHSQPPYGAYGLNTGLEDAVNLAWKLAAVLRGWAPRRLLDTYSVERRPIMFETAQAIIDGIAADRSFLERYSPQRDASEFEQVWGARTAGETAPASYEPHYDGSPIVCGLHDATTGVRGQHSLEARAGHHLSPALLSSGHNVFSELGRDHTLIALTQDSAPVEAFQEAAHARRMPLHVIVDTFAAGRTGYEHRYILVRPDQFVAWAGNQLPADPAELLRKTVGANGRPEPMKNGGRESAPPRAAGRTRLPR
jgi:4-hydroxyisophthalate hydroxylase